MAHGPAIKRFGNGKVCEPKDWNDKGPEPAQCITALTIGLTQVAYQDEYDNVEYDVIDDRCQYP